MTYKYFMTNKFRFWALFYKILHQIKPKNIKIGNISFEREKGAKNSYGSYPTEFVFEVKNEK
jgi:hypothetical protein